MQKDSKHKTTPKSKSQTRLVVLIILVALLTPISMYYIRYQNIIHRAGKVKPAHVTEVKQPTHEPQFHFYTLLSQTEVEVEIESTPGKPKTNTYVLQIAALKNREMAVKLQYQLSKLNVSAYIQTSKVQDGTWYKVYAGPYLSLAKAQDSQQRLENLHYKSLLLKLT